MLAGGASAQEDECVATCRDDASACRFDAREAFGACIEEAGCDVLRENFRELCLVDDRDEELCADLRTGLRECTTPCREAFGDDATACREAAATCLQDVCGVEPRDRDGRGGRGFRGRR